MTLRAIICGTALLAAGLVMSCNKDDDDNAGTTPEQQLASSPWKLSTATAAGTNITSNLPACYIDNQLTFVAGGTGSVAEGTNVCDPTTAGTFTWSLAGNNSTITINTPSPIIPGGSSTFTLVLLSADQMVLSQDYAGAPTPVPITIIATFVH